MRHPHGDYSSMLCLSTVARRAQLRSSCSSAEEYCVRRDLEMPLKWHEPVDAVLFWSKHMKLCKLFCYANAALVLAGYLLPLSLLVAVLACIALPLWMSVAAAFAFSVLWICIWLSAWMSAIEVHLWLEPRKR